MTIDLKKHYEAVRAEEERIKASTVKLTRRQLADALNKASDLLYADLKRNHSSNWRSHLEALEETYRNAANLIACGARMEMTE